MDISSFADELNTDIDDVTEWAEKLYQKHFGQYFHTQKALYTRLQSKDKPITDTELEQVLTELPLELIVVAESLAKFQLGEEVVKLRYKEDKLRYKEDQAKDLSYRMLENDLMTKIYSCVADRVSREMSFSRELIMSCKKIWDRRKDTDTVNPIGTAVAGQLPEYVPPNIGGRDYVG